MSTRFSICWPFILAQECPYPNDWSNPANFSLDAHDPGGATMCGIIQAEYNLFRSNHGEPTQPVNLITESEGASIYYNNYWLPKCDSFPPGADLEFADTSVNQGPTGATYVLQAALGISVDGIWGPITNAAVLGIKDVPAFIRAFAAARLRAYQRMAIWQYFHNGWTNRNNAIEADALSMVTTPQGVHIARPYNRANSIRPTHLSLRMPIKVTTP